MHCICNFGYFRYSNSGDCQPIDEYQTNELIFNETNNCTRLFKNLFKIYPNLFTTTKKLTTINNKLKTKNLMHKNEVQRDEPPSKQPKFIPEFDQKIIEFYEKCDPKQSKSCKSIIV